VSEREDSKVVGIRLPMPLYKKLKRRVEASNHLSQGEYIRTLLRKDLEEEKP